MSNSLSSGFRFCRYFIKQYLGRDSEPGEWRRLQEERLRVMVRHAYENVPLYREKYDKAGIDPDSIRTLDDLQRLPMVSKDDLKKGFPFAILSRRIDPGNCLTVSTSGSTGSPVRVFRDRRFFRLAPLPLLLGLLFAPRFLKRWGGSKLKRRMTIIAPKDEGYDIHLLYKQLERLPRFLRGGLQYLDTTAEPGLLLEALLGHRPDVVAADPVILQNIAAEAGRLGRPLPAVKLLVVGGAFSGANARARLAEAYGGRVIEHYGAMEAGTIAFACPDREGLHPLWTSVIVETVRDGKPCAPDTPGEVVVTNLWNTVTPIIRYAGLGDTAVQEHEACSCGSPAPRLTLLGGRQVDALVLPDGSVIHPFRLTLALERIPRLDRFQIIQEAVDRVRVKVVIDGAGEEAVAASVMRNLNAILGDAVTVLVEAVNDIPRLKGTRTGQAPVLSLLEPQSD
ncbi:MAG: AMP-binding protein [Candidatus Aminicenantes bacterium]|nr:AMP-binding protein [Candidatus Aminicenantes bacterium]